MVSEHVETIVFTHLSEHLGSVSSLSGIGLETGYMTSWPIRRYIDYSTRDYTYLLGGTPRKLALKFVHRHLYIQLLFNLDWIVNPSSFYRHLSPPGSSRPRIPEVVAQLVRPLMKGTQKKHQFHTLEPRAVWHDVSFGQKLAEAWDHSGCSVQGLGLKYGDNKWSIIVYWCQ